MEWYAYMNLVVPWRASTRFPVDTIEEVKFYRYNSVGSKIYIPAFLNRRLIIIQTGVFGSAQ